MNTSTNQIKDQILIARRSDLEKSKELCLSLLNDHQADYHTCAFAYTFLADYYFLKDDMDNCTYTLYIAKTLSEKNEFEDLLIRIYHYYGIIYLNYGDYQTSVDYYFKALKLSKKNKMTYFTAAIYNNIANIFETAEDLEEAFEYYKKGFETLNEPKSSSEYQTRAVTLTNLCNISYQKERYDQLAQYYTKFLAIPKEVYTDTMTFLYHFNQFLYHVSIHQIRDALHALDHLMNAQELLKDRMAVYQMFVYVCDILIKINEQAMAWQTLQIIEKCDSAKEAIHALKVIEMKIHYYEQFQYHDELIEAYKEYYEVNLVCSKIIRQNSSDGLKAKIKLHKSNDERMEIQHQNKRLELMMNMDELTNCLNRRFFDHYLVKQFAENPNHPLGIAMIDIDCFKEYNDYYGHIEGDKILYEVGASLDKFKQESFHVCRFGGDEFACIFEHCSSEDIEAYLKAVYEDLAKKKLAHEKSNVSSIVTISTGYVLCAECSDLEMMIRCADEALYHAKRNGRNCWRKSIKSI